ncbi:hypothetical protein DDW09_03260 [Sulfolobus sp. SCGC AB-777_L09]|jgi:hypothetical protein|nr:hypothetical protein DDW09_03260 [Sulfolobus sp. SCGC AB-777_L09]
MPALGILIDIVLEDIKEDLKRKLGKEVPSISVKLVDYLPPHILAYVRANDYTIYVNSQQYMRARELGFEYDYLYVLLLHEILHILGIADEREVRRIDLELIEEKFGEESFAYRFALELLDPRDLYLKGSQRLGGKPNTFM